MLSPVVVVAGSPGVGKSAITARLSPDQTRSAQGDLYWDIDTKYYTARVHVQEAGMHSQREQDPPEALVLVIDCQSAATFHAARSWAEAGNMLDAEVKLLVANKADLLARHGDDQARIRPQWLLDAFEWCTSCCMEYIEVCAVNATLDATLEVDGDQHGLARVVQALHAHMWPGMVLKSRSTTTQPQQPHADSVQSAAGTAQQRHASLNSAASTNGDSRTAGLQHSTVQTSASVLVAPADDAAGRHEATLLSSTLHQTEPPDPEDTDSELGAQEVEAFEKIFLDMQGAKERLADLPDADRRAGAAALAMRLASLLGLDSDEEDSGQDSA